MNSVSSNPFSTRFIAPGAMSYVFAHEDSIKTTLDSLVANGWRGQVFGPHGTGKTSLLWHLFREFERQFREFESQSESKSESHSTEIQFYQFQANNSNRKISKNVLAKSTFHLPKSCPRLIRIIDGYERMSWLSRQRLHLRTTALAEGLVVSTHRKTNLPIIFDTRKNIKHFQSIVTSLTAGAGSCSPVEVEAALERHGGNIREALFELYDRWENKTAVAV